MNKNNKSIINSF